jgi:hypothetical protein
MMVLSVPFRKFSELQNTKIGTHTFCYSQFGGLPRDDGVTTEDCILEAWNAADTIRED